MPDSLDLQFVLIPDAEFIIGSDLSRDKLTQDDEKPEHRLRVTDFYIMKYPKRPGTAPPFLDGPTEPSRKIRPIIPLLG